MGKKGKKRRAAKRRELKRRAKEAKRALYKRYAEEGRRRGSKRSRKKKGSKSMKAPQHSNCGNIGCLMCNPQPYNLPRRLHVAVKLGRMMFAAALRERRIAKGYIQDVAV